MHTKGIEQLHAYVYRYKVATYVCKVHIYLSGVTVYHDAGCSYLRTYVTKDLLNLGLPPIVYLQLTTYVRIRILSNLCLYQIRK